MDKLFEALQEHRTSQALFVGMLVAGFLFHTNRLQKAIEIYKECLVLLGYKASKKEKQSPEIVREGIYIQLFNCYVSTNDHKNGIEYGQKLLELVRSGNARKVRVENLMFHLAKLYERQGRYKEVKSLLEEALTILTSTGNRQGQVSCNLKLGKVCQSLFEYDMAKKCFEQARSITRVIGDRRNEASCNANLGTLSWFLSKNHNATKYLKKSLEIRKEVGDKQGEAADYGNLANVFQSLGDYDQAKECIEKAIAISRDICDREYEAASYANLANVFKIFGKYDKAIEYNKKAIEMFKESGDREGAENVAICYGNLGTVFQSLSEYTKAKEYHEKALEIRKEIGHKEGEAADYINLGTLLCSKGECHKAKEYFFKALPITKEIANEAKEASCYGHIGSVFASLCKYATAKEYLEKGLEINKKIGHKQGEAACYIDLGNVFVSLGEYDTAKEYYEKALAITKETGHREGEATCYGRLGNLFHSLYDNSMATDYYKKGLAIGKETGNRKVEASCYGNLGDAFCSLGEYATSRKCLEKALEISKEIGDREGEGRCYGSLGGVLSHLNDHDKALKYTEKALSLSKETGDIKLQASSNGNLGCVYLDLGEYAKAKQCYERALALNKEIGNIEGELRNNAILSLVMLVEGKIEETKAHLLTSIHKCERMRSFFEENERYKILLVDEYFYLYQFLSYLLCITRNHLEGLQVVELGRARALVQLMSAQYSVDEPISIHSLHKFSNNIGILKKENNCACLYISSFREMLLFWVFKAGILVDFRRINVNDCWENKETVRNLFVSEVFAVRAFRKFHVVVPELCEDRSWFSSNADHPEPDRAARLPVHPNPTLSECYKMIIAPVIDLLDGTTEIIIVPDPVLFKVPFAALPDKGGSYLSETFRIRIVPSLTTLNLIHNSPADYHSQTGALMVGDPDVGWVLYKGSKVYRSSLPFAREEARMLGRILGAETLLGKEATKQAVLHSIHSKSLVHFAAHGNPKTGEIYLARPISIDGTPQEEDYLLTMADISKVQLRAKLVVLSCCHTTDGEIRAEGVVGMARAFLGSGARSVLAARWAVDDEATMHFMFRFYYHLVRGESASESLHKTMKWMRAGPYSKVQQWAPFMLIGDNVTFNFNKKRYAYEKTIDQFLNY